MRIIRFILILLGVGIFIVGCSSEKKAEENFNAHFGDMDKDSSNSISLDELKSFFPDNKSCVTVFIESDKNGNKELDHGEWGAFKRTKGYKCLKTGGELGSDDEHSHEHGAEEK